ncbi:MAG: hypothetical protein HRU09_19330 [Oligoflexales bacterium]|nr:hypothetical protein [Oligoflexales bacterium]
MMISKTLTLLLLSTGITHSFISPSVNQARRPLAPLLNKGKQSPFSNGFTVLASTNKRDQITEKLDGEFGYNPFFEQFLIEVRNNEKSIATRSDVSAYVSEKKFKHLRYLKTFLTDRDQMHPYTDQGSVGKELFSFTMTYLTIQEFYHQLVFNPFVSALKKSGYMDESQEKSIKSHVKKLRDQYSAKETNVSLFENSEVLEQHFNHLMLGLLEDSGLMLGMAKAKEANAMIAFMTTLDKQKVRSVKEEEKIDHDFMVKKMAHTAEGLGLEAMKDLVFSNSKVKNEQILPKVFNRAEKLYDNFDEATKDQYLQLFHNWSRNLQKNPLSKGSTKMTKLWLDKVEKLSAQASFLKIASEVEFDPKSLRAYSADRRVVVIYKPKGSNSDSYYGLKTLAQITLPGQEVITIDNPKDLAKSIMQYRNELGYLLIPDGDLDTYYQGLKDLKPAIDDAVRFSNWDILGIGSGGTIFADFIIEHLGNARHMKKGLGLIPGEGGQVLIPNGSLIYLELTNRPAETLRMKNKGNYIKSQSDSDGKTNHLGSYQVDDDLGASVLSYKKDGGLVFFSSPRIESFLSNQSKEFDHDTYDVETIEQSLAVWYQFLEQTKAKRIL